MSNVTSIEDCQDRAERELYEAETAYWIAYEAYNKAKERLTKALEAVEKYV